MGSGRPPTDLGTWGAIHTFRVRDGAYRARTRIRDADGMTRQVTATGTTKAAADRALRAKLAERKAPTEQSITAETTIAKLGAIWSKFLRDEGRLENTTMKEYQRVLHQVELPGWGGLRLRVGTNTKRDHYLTYL